MNLNNALVRSYKAREMSNKKTRKPHHKRDSDIDEKPAWLASQATNLKPTKTFDHLCGVDYVRGPLLDTVNLFKRAIEAKTNKSKWPVLICGSKGLGKTSLIEAAANYSGLNLVTIPLVQLAGMTRNEFIESIQHLTAHCISNAPAIVLIDNLERILEKEEYRHQICETIRRLLSDETKLLVFCATASPLEDVSEFDFLETIQLKRPTLEAREKILIHLCNKNENLSKLSNICFHTIATMTPSFTALDLEKMLKIAETHSDGKPTMTQCGAAIEVIKQSFKPGTHLIGERPKVTWSDIGGMTEVREAFADILKQTRRSGRSCKFAGVALYGPPGCGKTMVAQAMANEGGFNFISIKPAELVDKFLGETEKNIRRVFLEAREHEPCMIYFDEFDGLCGTRGNRDTVTSAIQTLLSEMDGFIDRGHSIVMVSTNRLEDIDPAILRPGRLSEKIYIGPPDEAARRDILGKITSKMQLSCDVDLDKWASETKGCTGAELAYLIHKAGTKADSEQDQNGDDHCTPREQATLRQDHFIYAHQVIKSNMELEHKTGSIKRLKY